MMRSLRSTLLVLTATVAFLPFLTSNATIVVATDQSPSDDAILTSDMLTSDALRFDSAFIAVSIIGTDDVLTDAVILPASSAFFASSIVAHFAVPEVAVTTNLDLGSSLIINRDAYNHLNGARNDHNS